VDKLATEDEAYVGVDMMNHMLGRSDSVLPVIIFSPPSDRKAFLPWGTPEAAMAVELPSAAYKRAKVVLPNCPDLKEGRFILAAGTSTMCLVQLRSPPLAHTVSEDISFPPLVSAMYAQPVGLRRHP
jgi:hypothetical protein